MDREKPLTWASRPDLDLQFPWGQSSQPTRKSRPRANLGMRFGLQVGRGGWPASSAQSEQTIPLECRVYRIRNAFIASVLIWRHREESNNLLEHSGQP